MMPGPAAPARCATGSCARAPLGGRLEGLDLDALRIDHADGVPDRAALAGSVHPLQHDQDPRRRLLRDPAGRVQPLLQVAELGSSAAVAAGASSFAPMNPGVADGSMLARFTAPAGSRRARSTAASWRPPASRLASRTSSCCSWADCARPRSRWCRIRLCEDDAMELIFVRGGGDRGRSATRSYRAVPSPSARSRRLAADELRRFPRRLGPGSRRPVREHQHPERSACLRPAPGLADAVIVAGGTARNEGYRAVDLHPGSRPSGRLKDSRRSPPWWSSPGPATSTRPSWCQPRVRAVR